MDVFSPSISLLGLDGFMLCAFLFYPQIETFQNNEKEFKAHMKTLREKFIELKQDSQREIAKMSEGRREVYQQLQTSKEEYECLKKVQREDMIKYQAEIAFLKQVRLYYWSIQHI